MPTFKRVLAWSLILISVVGILVCSLGMIGSWLVNQPATDAILKLLAGADAALLRVEASLTTASTQLEAANSAISTARQAAAELGDRFEKNSPILDRVERALQDSLIPAVGRIRAAFLQVQERILVINNTIEALNALPGIQLPTLILQLQALNEQVELISSTAQQVQQNISDFKAGVVDRLEPFREKTDSIAVFLKGLEQDVNTYLQQVHTLQSNLEDLQKSIPTTIDTISILVTLLFAWLILAQVSLLVVARVYLKTGRLLWQLPDEATSGQVPAAPVA